MNYRAMAAAWFSTSLLKAFVKRVNRRVVRRFREAAQGGRQEGGLAVSSDGAVSDRGEQEKRQEHKERGSRAESGKAQCG